MNQFEPPIPPPALPSEPIEPMPDASPSPAGEASESGVVSEGESTQSALRSQTSKRRFLAAYALATFFALIVSIGVGVLAYLMASAGPEDRSGWESLGWFLAALFFGGLAFLVAFPLAFAWTLRRFVPDLPRRRVLVAVATLLPVMLAFGSYAVPVVGVFSWIMPYFYYASFAVILRPFALTLLVLLAVSGLMRLRWLGAIVGALIVASAITYGVTLARFDQEDKQDVIDTAMTWSGPLYLIDGSSLAYPDSSFRDVSISRPYNNESYENWSILWRQDDNDPSTESVELTFANTHVAEECTYEMSCSVAGTSKLGTVYKLEYTYSYIVDDPKGHLEVGAGVTADEAIRLFDTLKAADPKTFAAVANTVESD